MRHSPRYAGLIALATALLVVVGSAQAAAVKVKPTISVVSAAKSGKYVRFQIGVKFPIPAGVTAPCSGKVTVSTKLSKKKTAKWSGKLAAVGPACVAKVKAKLASVKYGKKLKFSVAFKGSKKLKPFSSSRKLRIVAPPPTTPLPPAAPPGLPGPPPLEVVGVHNKGNWDINAIGEDNSDFEFFIEPDYSVAEIKTHPNGKVQLQCKSTTVQSSIIFNTGFEAKSDSITVHSTQNDDFISMVHTFHFSWTSPTSGVGHYSSSGQYNIGDEETKVWEHCTGGFNFVLEHFVP